ncbi:sphingomyelin phosphodiesterase 4 isoform X1 [Brachionus plicatilis]|uniref:Sphingomyelin phosphodiesterase 4 isoform X1 n=1 Tax=Brachionus plicatilis TaxID=10195 RepID=A0A3M7QWH4_BRAPC|nr:sphingomyelin phosphodiesterase 4 isoform X1 [Brachionus plicatilis]
MYMHVQSRLSDKTNRQDAIRQSAELNNVLNMFQEVDESIACFHFLNDLEHIKMVNRLYEILTNAKWMMNQRVTSARNASSLEWFKSMFVDEQQVQFAQMSEQECVNSIKSIDRCLQMIRMFYEERASFEEFESEEQQVPSEQSETGDYESGEDRMVKLTPKGRFRVINRIRKANVETSYDPEQAAIGDFEIRFLVYVCQFVSDLINENFLNFFQKVYNRNDTVGRVAKKCLYVSKRDGSKPKLNLRHLASYKFVFYFFVYLLLLNVLTGYSLLILVPFVLFIYFAYFNLLV